MLYYLTFLTLLLTAPLSLLSMEENSHDAYELARELYFHQVDTRKNWSNSSAETFFFINNLADHHIPNTPLPEIKNIIKNNFITIMIDEQNLWEYGDTIYRWNIPITTNDFLNLNKKDKKNTFTLCHASHFSAPNNSLFRRWGWTYDKKYESHLCFESKYYDLLLMLPLHIRTKIADKEGSCFVYTINSTQDTNSLSYIKKSKIILMALLEKFIGATIYEEYPDFDSTQSGFVKKSIVPEKQ